MPCSEETIEESLNSRSIDPPAPAFPSQPVHYITPVIGGFWKWLKMRKCVSIDHESWLVDVAAVHQGEQNQIFKDICQCTVF